MEDSNDTDFKRTPLSSLQFDVSMKLKVKDFEDALNMLWLNDIFPVLDDNGRWHMERGASLL